MTRRQSAREVLNRSMTDADLREAVTQAAELSGWLVYHETDSRRTNPGWPDLLMIRPPRIVVAEAKRRGDKVTDAQRRWLDTFVGCGVEVWELRAENLDRVIASVTRRR